MKRVQIISPINIRNERNLRVAAYCRVSTSNEKQKLSYQTQKQYYEELISKRNEWRLVEVYADEGITGTSTKNRSSFNQMIEDCQNRLIDKIITKSVTRFARNTIDTLAYVRLLKSFGVSVLFEKENLDTEETNSEILLSVLATIAQEESFNISRNLKWSYERKMRSGEWLPSCIAYGYDIVNNSIIVNKEQSKVVKIIFKMYLNGYSAEGIAEYLNTKRIDAPRYAKKWNISSVLSILKNPIYTGKLIAQKTFTTETIPFRKKVNNGEKNKYHYMDNHEAIVTDSVFEKAKEIRHFVRVEKGNTSYNRMTYNNRTVFSGKLKCRYSGVTLKQAKANCRNPNEYIVFRTSNSKDYSGNEHSINIRETEIKSLFEKLIYKLKYYPEILQDLIEGLIEAKFCNQNTDNKDLEEQEFQLTKSYNLGLRSREFYIQELGCINSFKAGKYNTQKISEFDRVVAKTEMIKNQLEKVSCCEFNEQLFESIIEKVLITKETVTFVLINQLELMEVRLKR